MNAGPRFVSLVPSATETLLALGAEVVACTRFCEQPHLPHVGGTKNPDIDAIVAMAPDVVVVDEEENRREDADALVAVGLELLVTAVRDVGGGLGAVDALAARAGLVAPDHPVLPAGAWPTQRAFVPIWRRPWMTINADTYGASLLAACGIHVVHADSPERYPCVELADLAALAPELVLVPSEPYEFTDGHLDELRRAAPASVVLRVDGQDLFWWGSRTAGAIERIAAVVRSARTTR